ncbi:MAG TPA: hypothetical protein DDY43_00600 [Synechococcales bacterium UBA10510]|nr:hypothetical protein [Synechococcales bacterium UBA10510]
MAFSPCQCGIGAHHSTISITKMKHIIFVPLLLTALFPASAQAFCYGAPESCQQQQLQQMEQKQRQMEQQQRRFEAQQRDAQRQAEWNKLQRSTYKLQFGR